MDTKKSKAKYQLAVLMDLPNASEVVLNNAIGLAKTIDGAVEVLCVKAPVDVVKSENQLSAMRTIHKDNRTTEAELQKLIQRVSNREGFPVSWKIAYGNIKNCIKDYISSKQPSIVIMGKQRTKLANFFGKGITEFVVNECGADVLIMGDDKRFHSFSNLSLGVFGNAVKEYDLDIISDLNRQTTKPTKFFSIGDSGDAPKEELKDTISYVFSEGSNALDGLTSYVSKTNTELFCISKQQSKVVLEGQVSPKEIAQRLDIPVLITK